MKRTRKPKRKQPRRLTPPLYLRGETDGSREILAVDEEILLVQQRYCSGRTTAYLTLAPGLRVLVGSRCVNKRRITRLVIEPGLTA